MRLFEVFGSRMFVIGRPSTYDPLLAKKRLRKAGKDFEPGYPGGRVYFSVDDATKAARKRGYGIYLLRYRYQPQHVYQNKGTGDWHLEHGMPIIRRLR
jgi:hypothetical protein